MAKYTMSLFDIAFLDEMEPRRLDRDDAGELFERGQARRDLRDAVVPEGRHALGDRGALELLAARLHGRQLLQRLAHDQKLEDADPALVAGLAAARAAALAVERHAVARSQHGRRDARLHELLLVRRVHLRAVRAELPR